MILKIAVSDFDGTMYFHDVEKVPEINKQAMKKWREKGNIFVFCSGRDMRSLMHELSVQGLLNDYDYIICNNGGTIFSKDLQLLYSFCLNKKALSELVHSKAVKDSYHLMFSAADKMCVDIKSEKSSLNAYFELEKYKGQQFIKKISTEKALCEVNAVQLSLMYANENIAQINADFIEHNFYGAFSANINMNCIDVCARGVDKSKGIATLAKLQHWNKDDIITIGDAQNDVPMLKAYQGCSLYSATKDAQQVARKLYDSVGEMLLKYM